MKLKLTIFSLLSACFFSLACLWDLDTLAMERKQFPNTLELITGKFLRHTPEYYYWRVKDRVQKLKENPQDSTLYDDLAVAYSKLGDDAKAIELMLEKEKLFRNLYETRANLGTFFIHDGQLQQGVKYIKKAIEINPDAHFGREVYQQLLVEYVLEKNKEKGGQTLPLEASINDEMKEASGFFKFLEARNVLGVDSNRRGRQVPINPMVQKAVKGVLGMMRFGNYDSPILLEALGDLLVNEQYNEHGAKQLAARAYLKASYGVKSQAVARIYRQKAGFALRMQTNGKIGDFFTLEI